MPPKNKAKRAQSPRRDPLNVLFHFLYLFLNLFIIIGEYTQTAIVFPYKITKSAILRAQTSLRRIQVPKIKKQPAYLAAAKGAKTLRREGERSIKSSWQFTKKIARQVFLTLSKLTKLAGLYGRKVLSRIFSLIKYIANQILKLIISIFTIRLRFFLLGFLVCFFIFSGFQVKSFITDLPSPRQIGSINYPLSTHIYDRNGKLLYEVYRDQNRTPIKINQLPTYISQATIAIEDKDFYHHKGVSLYSGILRAMKETVLKNNLQGGSTITQQLVKSALLTPERSVERKIKEIVLALWAERIYTKDQILEMYLNQVPYGGSAYGIEEAAKTYLGKSARDLDLSEAALLAGLPQSPSIYSPFVNPQFAIERRNEVLTVMEEQKYISHNQHVKAEAEKVNVIPPQTLIKAPHFVFHVKSDLERDFGVREVEEGGFKVTTSLDLDLQQAAETILKEELDKVRYLNVTNGAILITRPSTGEILAMVGSVDYFNAPSGAYNVTTALRQPGSSIKPLMYSLALERNYTAATIIDDSPISFRISNTEVYKPVNYDGKFHGRIPLRYALANSFNIPAVKTLNTLGVDEFVNHARRLGITTWHDSSQYGLSLTLGGGEVKMTDMATAFGVFANAGYKVPVNDIVKVLDSKDRTREAFKEDKSKVLNEGVAYIMSDILSDNGARVMAFGAGSQLEIPGYKVAVKTGTTDNKKDNWTIGYTPNFLVAVWVGNNDGTPMNPFLTSGVTGAAPIWHRMMEYVLKNYSKDGNNWFQKPENVVEKPCYYGRVEFFLQGTENQAGCYGYGKPSTAPQPQTSGPQPTQAPQPKDNKRDNKYNQGRGQ